MTETLALLQDFYREKLEMLLRHQAGARSVRQYDQNNTYQYIVNREETELTWVGKAIEEMGGTLTDAAEPVREARGKAAEAARAIMDEDGRDAQAFVDRWRARIDRMTNDRHKKMLAVILGEVLEQKRFFEQALAGRTDLLGRRGEQVGPSHGTVLSSRWIE